MNIITFLFGFHALWTIQASLAARVDQAPSSISPFEVHSLPGAPSLPPSWAGRLPVPDVEEGNSLFFWLVEAEDSAYDDNLISQLTQIHFSEMQADKTSLAQRRPRLFVLARTDRRQRSNVLRWQLDQAGE